MPDPLANLDPDSPVSPGARASLEKVWGLALSAAGFACDDVRLFTTLGSAPKGEPQAAYLKPDEYLCDPCGPFRDQALEDANREENVTEHRVAVYVVEHGDDLAEAVLAGKLRHELRHAEQARVSPDSIGLAKLADGAAKWHLRGESFWPLYKEIPTERDANAAASMFLESYYPAQIAGILAGPDRMLAQEDRPLENLGELPGNVFEFLLEYREDAEAFFSRGVRSTFIEQLGLVGPQWVERWESSNPRP